MECISSESCTAFQLLLFELFGEFPDQHDLTGIVIDRGFRFLLCFISLKLFKACDVHPYVKRVGEQGHHACAHYANLAWMVDPFHIDGHKV